MPLARQVAGESQFNLAAEDANPPGNAQVKRL